MSKEENKKMFDELARLGEELEIAQKQYDTENDHWWESLSQEQRENAFYAVVKRIVQGELRDRGTYRYILYDVFGFGPGYYVMGMNCGFMDLHNHIVTSEEIQILKDKGIKNER